MYYVLDMEDPELVEEWCDKHAKEIGTIDVLIHNAGLSMRDLMLNTEISLGQRLLNVDFLSIFAMTKAFSGNMRKDGKGSVVCGIGSLSGIHGTAIRSMYGSVKGAMDGFFKSLAAETKQDNVHSMVVHPGYVQTNVANNALTGDGSTTFGKTDENIRNGLTVEDCANQIIEGM
jgi:short-subunit dehydrogenase